ncbi:MAG: ribosome recycling factor [Proteobacteria bacterium]|nr:ribosome recycling factor [Pseudomonadota bacterium]
MDIKKQTSSRMDKTVAALVEALGKIRSGRAHGGLLDNIMVNCYGSDMPLAQLATVSVSDARTLTVMVWDKQNAAAAEKAIRDSDLGVNPAASGLNIRVTMPDLSEERRRDLGKVVGREAEEARIAVRNIRRDAVAEVKTAVKDKEIGEDEGRRLEQEIEKSTKEAVGKIDKLATDKQQELMTV